MNVSDGTIAAHHGARPAARAAQGDAAPLACGMVPTVALVAALWTASSWGYYALVETLALENGYDDAPVVFAAYYLAWAAVALLSFRSVLSERIVRATVVTDIRAMVPVLAAVAVFVAFLLPTLPAVSVWRAPVEPPEFMFASGWYYLPKSADILFQQVLLAAMIHTAASLRLGLAAIAIGMGLAFGGFHLVLALDGFTALRRPLHPRRHPLWARGTLALPEDATRVPVGLYAALVVLRAGCHGHPSRAGRAAMGVIVKVVLATSVGRGRCNRHVFAKYTTCDIGLATCL